MDNVNLNATVEAELASAIESVQTGVKSAMELAMYPTMLGKHANLAGGIIGTLAATILESCSRNGTKSSIVATVATGSIITVLSKNNLEIIPNTGATAAATGTITFVTSRCVGRSVAEYFPPVVAEVEQAI